MFGQHCLVFKEIKARGVLRLADVLRLRRDYLPNGARSEEEALSLLALNAACPVQDISWTPFLTAAVSHYIVHAAKPEGYLTAGKARWLMSHASTGGRIERLSCLELLIAVLEAARWSPPSLSAFVLRQIEMDIVTGTGPLRTAATSGKGRVGTTTAFLVHRILAAGDRAGNTAITHAEAEVLLDIHDATVSADNCLEWTELFTKAVANILMTASGYAAPARVRALRSETWLDPTGPQQSFVDAMAASGFEAVLAGYTQRSFEDQALAHIEHHKVEIITAEPIPAIDPAWLAGRLQKAPAMTPATLALLTYLGTQDRALHPAFTPLLAKAA